MRNNHFFPFGHRLLRSHSLHFFFFFCFHNYLIISFSHIISWIAHLFCFPFFFCIFFCCFLFFMHRSCQLHSLAGIILPGFLSLSWMWRTEFKLSKNKHVNDLWWTSFYRFFQNEINESNTFCIFFYSLIKLNQSI